MDKAVSRYLKQGLERQWDLEGDQGPGIGQVVVAPCLGELKGLGPMLQSLAENEAEARRETLVIVVVNNRPPGHCDEEDREQNQVTLAALRGGYGGLGEALRLAWVDAASPGRELPPKEGVGLARKIGLDWGLQLLLREQRLDSPLICLDGDTVVAENYLSALGDFFAERRRWGVVLDYAHRPCTEQANQAAIVAYELHLRYHEWGLGRARSPYAYTAIGSAMACTARAYASVAGMPKRQAGEDFYFLEKLAKTGPVEALTRTTVYPSGRPSHRVPFGTGRSVQRFLDEAGRRHRSYHPATYDYLGDWLALAEAGLAAAGPELLDGAQAIWEGLAVFLEEQGFPRAWANICAHTSDQEQRRRQFHHWFDGFRTLKFVHHVREHGAGDYDLFAALEHMATASGHPDLAVLRGLTAADLAAQERALESLRQWSRHTGERGAGGG